MEYNHKLVEKLLDKSKEAFLLAIEIYNKPSIRYRVEGFSFFICNAWELMLKAHLMKTRGDAAIYFKDNPNRTISLENCIKTIFTNEHSPIHKNLMRIIELRNTSTHFIVEEYEMLYVPLFQSCVFNYTEKMQEFHDIDMTRFVPQNFLTLTVTMEPLNVEEIRAKYPGQVAEKLLSVSTSLNPEIDAGNSAFAIKINHFHYITKNRSKATEILHIDSSAESGVQIIKQLKDPNDEFKYNMKKCIKEINSRLTRGKIQLKYNGETKAFNSYHFNLFCNYYKIKENPRLCYVYRLYEPPTYSYSIHTIEFIVEEIRKDPENIIGNMKSKLAKEKS